MNTAQLSIQRYINAKDSNCPHLLSQVFMPKAILDMVVRMGSISFPDHVEGREPIGEVLVSRFGQTFENVYTFCLGAPPPANADAFQCKWLSNRPLLRLVVGLSAHNPGLQGLP